MKTLLKSQIITAALFVAIMTSCKNNTANTEGDGSNATDQTIPSEGMPAETDTTSTQMDTTSTNGTSGAAGASGTQESGNENGTGSTGSGSR